MHRALLKNVNFFPTVDTTIVDGAIVENGIIVGFLEDGGRDRGVGRGRGGRRGRGGGRGRGRGGFQRGFNERAGVVNEREESWIELEIKMMITLLICILALWVCLLTLLFF